MQLCFTNIFFSLLPQSCQPRRVSLRGNVCFSITLVCITSHRPSSDLVSSGHTRPLNYLRWHLPCDIDQVIYLTPVNDSLLWSNQRATGVTLAAQNYQHAHATCSCGSTYVQQLEIFIFHICPNQQRLGYTQRCSFPPKTSCCEHAIDYATRLHHANTATFLLHNPCWIILLADIMLIICWTKYSYILWSWCTHMRRPEYYMWCDSLAQERAFGSWWWNSSRTFWSESCCWLLASLLWVSFTIWVSVF